MIVLPKEEVEKINKVVRYIVTRACTVKEVKEKFDLTAEAYEMCMEFAMPQIRWKNEAHYYRMKFAQLLNGISKIVAEVSENRKNPIKEFDDA